jgi:hypothetical protein
MVEMYGPAFTSAYGDAPSTLWTLAIGNLTDEQCKSGLERLAKQGREWPPNLGQFVAACTWKPTQSTLGVGTTPQMLLAALPAKPNPELATSWMQRIRRTLVGER